MGVEYKHFLIPENPSFVPDKEVFKKVDEVLIKWNLKKGTPKIHDLTQGKNSEIKITLDEAVMGHGLCVAYPQIDGVDAARLMGRSGYGDKISDERRYIEELIFMSGTDYRIHSNNEEIEVTVVDPPAEDDETVEPYCEYDESHFCMHAEAYHTSLNATAPTVDVWVPDKKRILGDQHFSGYWRTAFCIVCGKDLPALGNELYTIPNREFIYDFEKALGTTIIEIGAVY